MSQLNTKCVFWMALPELEEMRLVGGTSLALQYGHRRSVNPQPMPYMFDDVEWDTIKQRIRQEVETYNLMLRR